MKSRFSRFLQRRLWLLFVGNLLLLLLIRCLIKQGGSFYDVLARSSPNVAPVILAGLGMTGIVFTGAIDLSIASIVVLAGTVFGLLVQYGRSPLVCDLACLTTAWFFVSLNGWLVRRLCVPAIIITLAGLAFYRGLALILADIAIANFAGYLAVQDDKFHTPGKIYAAWILLVVLIAALIWERFAKTPRCWLALGNSREACNLLGLQPDRILQSAFFAGGLFLGLAALVYVTRVQAIEPARMALGFELQVIGAVVLGGTNIFGGEGSFAGTALGAFFLYFAAELLIYAGVSAYFQEVIVGFLIVLVIGLDCASHRSAKWLAELA